MSGYTTSLPLLPGCSHLAYADMCRTKRETYKVLSLESDTGYVWTHESCGCNESVALSARHQVDDGARFNPRVYPRYLKSLLKLYRGRVDPISFQAVINGYSGVKRRLAEQAVESLQYHLLNGRDGRVKMFLKDDKYHVPEYKAPRCIQYRSKRYAVCLARYTYPLEKDMCKYRLNGLRVFAKGRTLEERAQDIQSIWESFNDPVCIIIDHSKFDAHWNAHLHKGIMELRQRQCRSNFLRKLYQMQVVNTGTTRNGTRYKTIHTRMSGDQNTGLDNSEGNFGILDSWLERYGIRYQIYLDGDDSIVVIERRHKHLVDINYLKNYGQVTKSSYAYQLEHIEFCSTRPVFNGVGYTMVRDPARVIARIGWVVKSLSMRQRSAYVHSVGLCEAALNIGVPIMGVLGPRIAAMGKGYYRIDREYWVKLAHLDTSKCYSRHITNAARYSMEAAYGISPSEQRMLENQLICHDSSGLVVDYYNNGGRHPFNHHL